MDVIAYICPKLISIQLRQSLLVNKKDPEGHNISSLSSSYSLQDGGAGLTFNHWVYTEVNQPGIFNREK